MSRDERYGTRDLTFSKWHRYALPDRATCIDLDFLEYCQRCRAPLALIETARDVGQPFKPTIVMKRLAATATVPAYLILYKLDPNAEWGISHMRVAQVYPGQSELRKVSPEELGALITSVHDQHQCSTAPRVVPGAQAGLHSSSGRW